MNDYSILEQTAGRYGAVVLKNEPMKNHTSFRIGGPCDVMIKINCEALLCELIKQCRENDIKYYVVGRGSNILVCDEGLQGVVLLIGSDFGSVRVDGEYIECNAGASLAAVCTVALENELTGLEFAYGIPGSVGGAIFMNAGAYGGEMRDIIETVTVLDETGAQHVLSVEELELGYRTSCILKKHYIVTQAVLKLAAGEEQAIRARMKELATQRAEKQPLEYPSAGSTFKRPEGYFAAKLIDDSGLRGYRVGGAMVSEKHCGFVVNVEQASSADVLAVMQHVQEVVNEKYGVMLEPEVRIIR